MNTILHKGEKTDYDIMSETSPPGEGAGTSSFDPVSHIGKPDGNTQSSSEALQQIDTIETIPPQPNSQTALYAESGENSLICCCGCAQGEEIISPTASGIGSNENTSYCIKGLNMMHRMFSSICYYSIILIVTFLLFLLLLAELLMDVNVIIVQNRDMSSSNTINSASGSLHSSQQSTIRVLHWVNFAVLATFFFEVLLRLVVKKIAIAKSLVAVWDSATVVVAFTANIVATLAAGYNSPYNAISLIIVFRFVLICSLMQKFAMDSKKHYREKLEKAESDKAACQLKNYNLLQQIKEQDFEIKQLHAHLGKNIDQLDGILNDSLDFEKGGRFQRQQRYESELQQVLALSKKEYEDEYGGYTNSALSKEFDYDTPSIIVHHRENSMKKDGTFAKYDKPSTSRASFSHRNITHDQLHSGGRTTSTTENTSILHSDNTNNSNGREWHVGYCLMPPDNADVINGKSHKFQKLFLRKSQSYEKSKTSGPGEEENNKHLDTSYHSDEGLGNELSISAKSNEDVVSMIPDGRSSDQSILSASSLCSESGYHSDEQIVSSSSTIMSLQVNLSRNLSDDEISTNTILAKQQEMVNFNENTDNESDENMEEDHQL